MGNEAVHKLDIALRQLDTAIRLFLEESDYYSVVTLAGAAEEIFGRELEYRGLTPSLQNLSQVGARISALMDKTPASAKAIRDRANYVRNNLKHYSPTANSTLAVDMRQEAIDMLSRAVDNAMMLGTSWSEQMYRFNDWFLENEVGL